ncbi:MAG TPA: glycosyltransferase family 2 protein [Ktedonobacteraceae bacterium]|jgi:egghead protein (zeste-white 4 protein)|nr:glycosyltransferase family 2 protein [Ktedonobacteraceae bacterium]
MQTDRPEDRASARLKHLKDQRLTRQNGKRNGMISGTRTQFNPLPFIEVPTLPAYPPLKEAVCDQSTMRMETVTPQKLPGEASNVPFLGTLPMPAVPTPILPEMSTLTRISNLAAPHPRKGVFVALLPWFYRCFLICATVILTILLLSLQGVLDHVPTHPSMWRTGVQWAELAWLAPVPLAIILWLGWFIFAEAVRPNPTPISLPFITTTAWPPAYASTKPVRLVFRFVTRGDNIDVLRDSVVAVHQAFMRYPQVSGPYQIEIVSECPVSLNLGIGIATNIYVVPPGYVTQHQSRFKARALTYLQECVRPQLEDWYIYLDEESLIDEKLLAGLYRFVQRSIEREARALLSKKKRHPAGWIGQGAILYQGGNWFFRGADALRTADDLGRFRLQYALGKPLFGIHGSYIVIRGMDDARLSFDVGSANSITEDAAWALRAWAQGYRFAWVDGYLHEQPPQRVKDFVRQRSRWLSGIRAVLMDSKIPFMYRFCLGLFTGLWQIAFLPFLIAVLALFVHASPFFWMRIPADFAWATFILAYLHGIDIQAKHSHPFLKKKKIELLWKRVVSWLLVFCSIWYTLLEAAGVIYSLRPKQGFFVIQKPSLAAENKIDTTQMQAFQQSWNTIPVERKK